MNKNLSFEQERKKAFYRVAWNVHHFWESHGASDTRLFMEPLIADKFVIYGQSKNGGTYKEHVVPRLLICNESLKMYENGSSVNEVSEFIEKFLKIVLITKEEQLSLDSKDKLNLKQSMPQGWEFSTGDVFARLRLAGIEFESNS